MAPDKPFFDRVRAFAAEARANKGEIDRDRAMDADDANALKVYDKVFKQVYEAVKKTRPSVPPAEISTTYTKLMDTAIRQYESLALDGWHPPKRNATIRVRRFDVGNHMGMDIGAQMQLAQKLIGYCGGTLEKPQAEALVMTADNYKALMAKQGKATKVQML